MKPLGRWLVPFFLLALGLTLIWLSSAIYADGLANLAQKDSSDCAVPTGQAGGPPICANLVADPEMVYGYMIGILGGITVIGGIIVSLARSLRN